MALSPVSKLNLVSLDKHKDKIIELLHNFGVAQIEDWEEKEKLIQTDEESPDYLYAQVIFAINFLNRFDETKLPLKDKLFKGKIELTEKNLKKTINEFDYKKIVSICEKLEAELNEQKSLIEHNKADKELLAPWQSLPFIPETEIETRQTKTLLGSLSLDNFQTLTRKAEKLNNVALLKAKDTEQEIYFALSFTKSVDKEARDILASLDFKPAQFIELSCPPKEHIAACDIEIKKTKEKIKETEKQIKKLTSHIEKLNIVSDYLLWKKEQKEALDKSLTTEKAFALLFWMEDQYLEIVKKELEKITKDFAIEKMPLKKDESIPITLKNKKLVEPFEAVTGIYGMPLKNEIDPTPYLAPFFFIFFGFCVSDAGYGIIITALMAVMYKLMKKPAAEKKLIKLLIFGGIATFIAGALFGSWFGIDISNMAEGHWFRSFVEFFKVIDPVKDPFSLLIVAFIFGLIQIMTGLVIDIYWKAKNNQLMDGLLGSGIWLTGFLVLFFWGFVKAGILPEALANPSTYAIYAVLAGLVIANGRKTKNIFLKLPAGLYSLYDIIGYLSDTLSYARLLALGLATGIIAMVINLIASLAIDMLPFVGYLLAVLILIGGHIFNIAVNALGGFIHSGRLQFVEFFPKFMEGGGVRFKPFRKESKYIRIINNK